MCGERTRPGGGKKRQRRSVRVLWVRATKGGRGHSRGFASMDRPRSAEVGQIDELALPRANAHRWVPFAARTSSRCVGRTDAALWMIASLGFEARRSIPPSRPSICGSEDPRFVVSVPKMPNLCARLASEGRRKIHFCQSTTRSYRYHTVLARTRAVGYSSCTHERLGRTRYAT